MMEEELIDRLLSSVSISAIAGGRIHWVSRPEGEAYPAMSLQVIADNREYTHDGVVDLLYPRIQFDCWAESYGEAKQLSRAVIAEIESVHVGTSIVFEDGISASSGDRPKEQLEGGTEVYRVMLDYFIPYRSKTD